ncbi:FG-GAP-like repeat-containing protein [Sphingopyxis sp.]|jgi:hypothetical protein|uniref:FG-GAP-like repeat-containing protein n=2 Tax=Pseudomonadota TaxID=1224 RepID=UPI003F6F0A00
MPLKSRIFLLGLAIAEAGAFSANAKPVDFEDVSAKAGILSSAGWKYGGPVVADLDRDGVLDLVLGNHDEEPAQLYWGKSDGSFVAGSFPDIYRDVHGMAAGDYDGDGDLDLLVAVGGGNGKQPRPPILLRLDGRRYSDVSAEAGISGYGARGRSVRWIDIDRDGDLDILAVNARQLPGESGPRNLVFENVGGTFRYRANVGLEAIEAERVLVTDINGDRRPDLLLFSPLTLLENQGEFRFRDVTRERLGENLVDLPYVTAASEADIDNDGDFDLYLARGKVYYEIADNALDFDAAAGRLDLRDAGNKGRDGVTFTASGPITLRDFWHWRRVPDVVLPIYIGAAARRADTPVAPFAVDPEEARGLPADRDRDGWYIGYLGDGRWRLEWNLSGDLAWDVRASVDGLSSVVPDWEPQDLDVADILLRNDGTQFADISATLPEPSRRNNWGVVAGDFDNDTRSDFFLYHFGGLRKRIADTLLLNGGRAGFGPATLSGATSEVGDNSHGDMGAAADFNRDGRLDILSGDDDLGAWHLYANRTVTPANWLAVQVGDSPRGTDPHGAVVRIAGPLGMQVRRVGSSGEVHSQSLIDQLHFGLGDQARAIRVEVTWRDGAGATLNDVGANQILTVGKSGSSAK